MSLQIDAVQMSCRAVARQVKDFARHMDLIFIVHHSGQYLESLTLAGQELLTHPASPSIQQILRLSQTHENSALLGMASWHKKIFLGLGGNRKAIAITTLNIDEFQSLREIRAQAWHMAWHALNIYNQRNKPEYSAYFQSGLIPVQRDNTESVSLNLRADIFSSVICGLAGDKDSIRKLAYDRCMDTLSRNSGHRPELYPYPIAYEATQVLYNENTKYPPSRKKQISTAWSIAESIALAYDEESVEQWVYFCKPAQDMIWANESPEDVLCAAISTSPNTFVRATGFLVSEVTGIKPSPVLKIQDRYSPFADNKYNQKLHESMVETVLQKAIHDGLENKSGRAFLDAANEQNQKLSNGHIFGWCAAALQASGRAFDSAIQSGSKTPDQAARNEFDGTQKETTWESLCQLGEDIIERYREGYAVTFSDIVEFCGKAPAFSGISTSITSTLKDPGYLAQLDIANDPGLPAPEPQPAPPSSEPRAAGPSTRPRVSSPGMSGGGMMLSSPPVETTQKLPPSKSSKDDQQDQ